MTFYLKNCQIFRVIAEIWMAEKQTQMHETQQQARKRRKFIAGMHGFRNLGLCFGDSLGELLFW